MLEKIKKPFKKALLYMPVFTYAMMSTAYATSTQSSSGNNIPTVQTGDIQGFIWNIVNALSDVATVVAVGFIVWNGYKIMSSSTNPMKRAEAMTGLFWSILGAIVALGAKWFVGIALGFKPQ
jgi:hypothetical protein